MRGTSFARRRAPFLTALTGALVIVAGTATVPAVAASDGYDWPSIDSLDLGEPAQEQLVASVTAYEIGGVTEYVTEGSVRGVAEESQESGETVVTLSSDILFDSSKAELSAAARKKIAALVAEIPDGAQLKVYGHTDSVDTDDFNQKLSEQRAKAVAGAVRDARADLKLDVQGFGESQLKVSESGDDAAADRAVNRRVELRYGG